MPDVQAPILEMLAKILNIQWSFQIAVGLPIYSEKLEDRLKLSEMYIHKTIEELVELRKEAPSFLNKYEKNPGALDKDRMQKELADVFLFLVNYFLLWGFDIQNFLGVVRAVQDANVELLSKKILGENYVSKGI